MSRPRWTIRRNRVKRWTVSQTDTITTHSFGSWSLAVTFVRGQISKWAVADLVRRAEESGEVEAIETALIDAPDLHRKRRRVIQAAWWRGLSVKVEFELDDDPTLSLLLVKVSRERAS